MIATSWLAPTKWQQHQQERIQIAISQEPDWNEYLYLVKRHDTPALSLAALRCLSRPSVPDFVLHELQHRDHSSRSRAILQCLELAKILKAFNRAQIPVIPLKGPILSAQLYGDIGLRSSNDLDIAIRAADIDRGLSCLMELGYRLDPLLANLTPAQWKKIVSMHDDLSFFQEHNQTELELHSHIRPDGQDQDDARWGRSIQTAWQGSFYQALDPIDQVLYLCCHGGYHAWFRAKWLGDLARIFASLQIDWAIVRNRAIITGEETSLVASLQLLHIVHGLPLPGFAEFVGTSLPGILLDGPLHALSLSREPPEHGPLHLLRDLHYSIRYPGLTSHRKPLRRTFADLFYCRKDYGVLQLPDGLFWAYAPLRPFLFVWRKLRSKLSRRAKQL